MLGLAALMYSCICYSLWRQPAVEKPAMFFFLHPCNVINFYTMQALACSPSSCCSPRSQPEPLKLSLGGGGRPLLIKGNTYSFRHRQHSWQGWTTTKRYIFFCQQSSHLSIQKDVWSFTGTSGVIIYYQHQPPHLLILIIHVKAHCDNNMHF